MKVLSIGNSFSRDAHKWLHKLAVMNSIPLETCNLYISGCSLERHWNNIENNVAACDFETNGGEPQRKITVTEALGLEQWDVVTVQQASGVSGIPESYEPYLSNIVKLIRTLQPKAEIWFHQTWAYETDAQHPAFENYGYSQREMYTRIIAAAEAAAASIPARLIPAGRLIQTLREEVPEFDYQNGGLSLCRDGFHMSYDYGCFAVAALWLRTLTGKQVEAAEFEDFDTVLLQKILKVVNA